MKKLLALALFFVVLLGLPGLAMAHEGVSHVQAAQSASSADVGVAHVSVDGKEVKAKSQSSVLASGTAAQSDCGGKKCVGKCSCSMATCCQWVNHKAISFNILSPQADKGSIMVESFTLGIMPESIAEPPKRS